MSERGGGEAAASVRYLRLLDRIGGRVWIRDFLRVERKVDDRNEGAITDY